MKKAKALVFAGYGLNCEEETKYGFEMVGGEGAIVHINDVVEGRIRLEDYQILAFPGGFAYGDDSGAGNAYAWKVRNHLWESLVNFLEKDRLVIGICNGFQILVNLGLLPAFNRKYGRREAALLPNSSARYSNRWTDMEVVNATPWLEGMTTISLPIAHGEGRFWADEKVISDLKNKKQISLRYIKGTVCRYLNLPANPNGSAFDIAGITDETGRVLGLMPHPDRGLFFSQLPHWPYLKEKYKREGKRIPEKGPGVAIFANAVRYFK